jgi:hypothetical protein
MGTAQISACLFQFQNKGPSPMPNITNRNCLKEVKTREKIYDGECSGLYVSLSPTAPPTFSLKYSCPITKKRATHRLGVYQQAEEGVEARDVAYWRIVAAKLKIRIANGEDIAQAARLSQELQAKQAGMLLGEMIDKYIAWISEEITVRRHTETGVIIKKKPRKKDWANTASHLNRFVRPRLGKKIASEVTNRDIAQLQADILDGTLIIKKGKTSKKGSVSSARHMRKAVSGLFNWAAEVGRDYVSASPCVNLPKLEKEEARKRKLSPAEIRILWHGLDRPDIVIDRRICLAIKFALVSMLRSVEMLHIHRDELGRNGLKLQNEKGELIWDFLERIARPRGVVMGSDELGNILLIGNHTGDIVGQLADTCRCADRRRLHRLEAPRHSQGLLRARADQAVHRHHHSQLGARSTTHPRRSR